MAPDEHEARTFRTRGRAEHRATGPTRSLGAGIRATPVEGHALLVELPDGLWTEALAAQEERARNATHVIAASETGWLVEHGREGTAYRGHLHGDAARPYALFPVLRGATLAPALARARAGEPFPPAYVGALALACVRGLAEAGGRDLSPSAIVVTEDAGVRIRGPLLDALVAAIGASEAPRWMAYVAPERMRRGADGAAAARFALGAMLLELSAGRPLFASSGAAAQQIATYGLTMDEIAALPADVPRELKSAIWTLLQRDPHRRATPEKLARLLAPLDAPSLALADVFAPVRTDAPYLRP